MEDSDAVSTWSDVWLQNLLYTLTHREQETIQSPSGWLNDSIIAAAQMLMLQHFPNMSGLQPLTLGQSMAFQVHRTSEILTGVLFPMLVVMMVWSMCTTACTLLYLQLLSG